MGVVTEEVVSAAFAAIRKRGIVVADGHGRPGDEDRARLRLRADRVREAAAGRAVRLGNPFDDIPRILELYRAGKLKLDELITTRYTLDQVNQGYEDMMAGRNIRGVIIHEH